MGVEEQRQSPRFDVSRGVVVRDAHGETAGRMVNLSLGGARISIDLPAPPAVGTRLWIVFSIPTLDQPIEVEANVRWRSQADHTTMMGVQFVTGLRAKQTWGLGRYLERFRELDHTG